jgi:putative membrane-bound dehydrogenase-like protein
MVERASSAAESDRGPVAGTFRSAVNRGIMAARFCVSFPKEGPILKPPTLLQLALVLALTRPALSGSDGAPAAIDMPRVLHDGLELQLFCREPDIVTPVQIDVDERGRVWAIESNTHFPQADYKRHSSDRILVMEDTDGDGKADRFDVFADGFQQTMAIALRGIGKLFVATRREVMFLEDADGDGRAERTTRLARLETVEQYPHNGLSGFAFDREGWLYFAIGENMAVPYRLIGSDGATVSGGPEGGSIFRMQRDGTRLERWATGFWNTFHMTFDGAGRLFAVDNDPDSRPPCRLLHIVRGGDYGYRRWLGRKGLHPFTAWNGELAGTLPMVSGTGEAPSGIVWYDRAGARSLPDDLRGKLILTSWGDHRIEVHALEERGASFRSRPTTIVQGGELFRPVGLAAAPDGSIYFSDWVDQDYHVHSKGRIWRLRSKRETAPGAGPSVRAAPDSKVDASSPAGRLAALEALLADSNEAGSRAAEAVFSIAGSDRDPFIECIAIEVLARACGARWLLEHRASPDARKRLYILLALQRSGDPAAEEAVDGFLADADLDVRRAAIQWVGEARLGRHRESLERTLESAPVSRTIFEAYLAAKSLVQGESPETRDAIASDEVLLGAARDAKLPGAVRAFALRSVSPSFPPLGLAALGGFLKEKDAAIRLEAVRGLRECATPQARELLLSLAENAAEEESIRREAIVGLARGLPSDDQPLRHLASATTLSEKLRAEASRALRLGSEAAGASLVLTAEERTALLHGGDPAEGEILFFYPRGSRCSSCHGVRGRGGSAGPDLSASGFTPRAKLLESILEPQKEIAPQYATWVVTMHDGLRTGTVLGEGPDGSLRLATASGETEVIPRDRIESRELTSTSLMPDGIASRLSAGELRDLLAFLESLR